MSKIRKLYFFDRKNTREMISFLNNSGDDTYINNAMFNPLIPLHHILPLKFKFLPESYVLKDKNRIKGLITIEPTKCPTKQMEIQKLLFEENCYDYAEELIQFAVSKYKAMGTTSFIVRIDDHLPELIKLFITKCGFSQISYEKLWQIKNIKKHDYNKGKYRTFRNSDSSVVSSLFNESLLPHIRPLLNTDTREFKEKFFTGLYYYTEYKYVIDDKKTENILAYISIQTIDNKNYILDIVHSPWTNIDLDDVIAFANHKISKRNKSYNLYTKTKKYTQLNEKYENEFMERKFECIQNQVVLTSSSAKIIRDEALSGKYTVLNKFYGGIGANAGTMNGKTALR